MTVTAYPRSSGKFTRHFGSISGGANLVDLVDLPTVCRAGKSHATVRDRMLTDRRPLETGGSHFTNRERRSPISPPEVTLAHAEAASNGGQIKQPGCGSVRYWHSCPPCLPATRRSLLQRSLRSVRADRLLGLTGAAQG